MAYYDAYLFPLRPEKLEAYRAFSKRISAVYLEYGATRVTDILLDGDGGESETFHAEDARDALDDRPRDFPTAAGARPGETVVMSWTEWPDKTTRDAVLPKVLADPRVQPDPADGVIFEGSRLISGAFTALDA